MELMNGQIHSCKRRRLGSVFPILVFNKRLLAVHTNKDSYEDFITYVPCDKPKRAVTFPPYFF